MLLDAIATVILAGMMLIPVINVLVGAIVGGGLASLPGCAAGVMLAIVITLAEKMIGDWRAERVPPRTHFLLDCQTDGTSRHPCR